MAKRNTQAVVAAVIRAYRAPWTKVALSRRSPVNGSLWGDVWQGGRHLGWACYEDGKLNTFGRIDARRERTLEAKLTTALAAPGLTFAPLGM